MLSFMKENYKQYCKVKDYIAKCDMFRKVFSNSIHLTKQKFDWLKCKYKKSDKSYDKSLSFYL